MPQKQICKLGITGSECKKKIEYFICWKLMRIIWGTRQDNEDNVTIMREIAGQAKRNRSQHCNDLLYNCGFTAALSTMVWYDEKMTQKSVCFLFSLLLLLLLLLFLLLLLLLLLLYIFCFHAALHLFGFFFCFFFFAIWFFCCCCCCCCCCCYVVASVVNMITFQ